MKISIKRADTQDALKLIEVQNKGFYEDYTRYGHCPAYNETEEAMTDMINNAIVYKILQTIR